MPLRGDPRDFFARGSNATISPCGQYRYRLSREIGPWPRIALFIMLNPSTADATRDDPSIRRCIGYAERWSCGALFVANLFAFRATDPRYITVVRDPVGPENTDHIIGAACRAHESGGVVVAAWGVHGGHQDRDRLVVSLLTQTLGIPLKCLGTTAEGFPRHPLYLTRETPLEPYTGRPLKGD
jgi:hypothetical protein